MKLTKRGTKYYLVKRVPAKFATIESRKQVWVALRTDSLSEANRRAVEVNRDLENQWLALSMGREEQQARYHTLSALAAARGFPYLPASNIADLTLLQILSRVTEAQDNSAVADAVLGSVETPKLMLVDVVDTYLDLVSIEVRDKGRDQRRMWENTIRRSVKRFFSVVGNKDVKSLTRDDALAYRNFWVKRINDEGISPTSANRDLSALSGVFSKIYKLKGLGDPELFKNIKFQSTRKHRQPYTVEMIEGLLIPALNSGCLNQDAADIVRILVNSGMRPSEVTGLAPDDIQLDHEFPHVSVRPRVGRELKTKTSIRDVPMVGVALEAIKRHPNGFPRYEENPSTLSATVNKFLSANGLRPTKAHSLYSLRHGFQDRLTAIEAPDRIQADLMGHRYVRERYGVGPSLEQKAYWLSKIAFF